MKKLALIPMLAFVLVGCAHNPQIAATVAGREIPVSDVDIVAKVLCASASAQSKSEVPMAQVNQYAVTYLAGSAAYEDLAKRQHVTLEPAVASVLPPIAGLSAAQHERAGELVAQITRASSGDPSQLLQTFAAMLEGEAQAGRFTANPRYPILSGSLSVPVSKTAKPDSPSIVALPASQKCGG